MRVMRHAVVGVLTEMRARGGWLPLIPITAYNAPGLRAAVAYLAKSFRGAGPAEDDQGSDRPREAR
jgi:hypothetical protein